MNELKKMIEDFLNGNYDALDFSYDLPDFLIEHHEQLEAEAPDLYRVFADELPDICASFERGADPAPFAKAVREEYEKVMDAQQNLRGI